MFLYCRALSSNAKRVQGTNRRSTAWSSEPDTGFNHNSRHQSPVTSHQSPVTSYQSPVTSHQLPVPVTSYQLPVTTSCQLPVTSCHHHKSNGDMTGVQSAVCRTPVASSYHPVVAIQDNTARPADSQPVRTSSGFCPCVVTLARSAVTQRPAPSFPRRRIHRPITPMPGKTHWSFRGQFPEGLIVIPANYHRGTMVAIASLDNTSLPRRGFSLSSTSSGFCPMLYPNAQKRGHSRKHTVHSREGGNPQFPRMREFIVPLPQCPGKTHHHSRKGLLPQRPAPSFPRRRESTIPAHAGIHRPITPKPRKNTPSFPQRPAPSFPRNPQFPRMREFIVPLPQCPGKTHHHSRKGLLRHSREDLLRHSREGGNPQFPRMREFIVPLPQSPGKTHRHSRKGLLRHSREGRESVNSRACGNSSSHYPNAQDRHSRKHIRHSREGGNPQFPRMREFIVPLHQSPGKTHHQKTCSVIPAKTCSVIPAKAGIHNSRACGNSSSHYPNAQEKHTVIPAKTCSVIPAKAGIHNSRACGNSSSHYPNAQEKHTVIPAKTCSVIPAKAGIHIPAHAGIHRPITPMPRKNTPSFPHLLRHSREGGNPQFPRMREFIVPLPQCPGKTHIPAKACSVIPAKAGIHNSRACGNSSSHYIKAQEKQPSFPQRPAPSFPRESTNSREDLLLCGIVWSAGWYFR